MKEREYKSPLKTALLLTVCAALPIRIHISPKLYPITEVVLYHSIHNILQTPFYAMIHNFHHPFQVVETVVFTLVSLHLAFFCENRKIKKVSPGGFLVVIQASTPIGPQPWDFPEPLNLGSLL